MEKPAPTDVPIHPLLSRRWSGRAIDPDRPVEPAKIRTILEAARWAPSCFNDQPWRYLVFDGRDPEARERARGCLAEGNAWARRAPLLLLSVAHEAFDHNGKPNRHGQHDAGLASENLVLQATELGLVTHQMAGFDAERARKEFSIPEGFTPMAMIAIGHPGRIEDLPEALQEREKAARTRKPASELMFGSKWGVPYRPE
jgi:nitroreductase